MEAHYGGRLRVRVCGVLRRQSDGAVLCALHKGVGPRGQLWVPPGGGLDFGESLTDCLKREFLEETNLLVEIGPLMNVYEFIEPPLHALELFYQVETIGESEPLLGLDPEWPLDQPPVLAALGWFGPKVVQEMGLAFFHKIVLHALGLPDHTL